MLVIKNSNDNNLITSVHANALPNVEKMMGADFMKKNKTFASAQSATQQLAKTFTENGIHSLAYNVSKANGNH
ncbi:hypothetical protein ACJQWY_02400 [Weissella kandleri]|uniref:hypothetical protein n=1 Tax=Weissella kandleri TaxID=1616 RepID=UPI00387E899C